MAAGGEIADDAPPESSRTTGEHDLHDRLAVGDVSRSQLSAAGWAISGGPATHSAGTSSMMSAESKASVPSGMFTDASEPVCWRHSLGG
jgi:hypothetical protein